MRANWHHIFYLMFVIICFLTHNFVLFVQWTQSISMSCPFISMYCFIIIIIRSSQLSQWQFWLAPCHYSANTRHIRSLICWIITSSLINCSRSKSCFSKLLDIVAGTPEHFESRTCLHSYIHEMELRNIVSGTSEPTICSKSWKFCF